jgi:hypothetical protein
VSIRLHRIVTAVAIAAPVLAGLTVAHAASAASIACTVPSLDAAVNGANATVGGGTVTLAAGCVYTLTKANNATDGGTGLPVITGKVRVVGNGATITRSAATGAAKFRILDVAPGGSLSLSSAKLSNGLADDGVHGGGAIFSHGTLSVSATTFSGNSSPATTGTSGGAIDSSGTLTVTTSTFTGNVAQEGAGVFSQATGTITDSSFTGNKATVFGGGGVVNGPSGNLTISADYFGGNSGPGGGAIDNDAALTVKNSTFASNSAGGNGGGAIVNFGTATVTQSTMFGNTAPFGSNLLNFTGFTLSISTSIVADGRGGANCGGGSPITDQGYNIDTGTSCGFSTASHSMSNIQPRLEPLASSGGPTPTMALATGSPALDAIPPATPGCAGTTDQRGVARPQGTGCDIGAFELIVKSSKTTPPTVPAGLAVTSVTANTVSLKWGRATNGVTMYTIYRNGAAVGTTAGQASTSFTDITAAPSTKYKYTVAAFDGTTNHSAQSAGVSVTTHAPAGISAGQGGAASTATQVTTTTIILTGPVHAGDLLVGWFGQFSATGHVTVSDNVNGAWTRSTAATTFSGGKGDIALYYRQNSKAAPWGLTITITAPSATFLQGVATAYGGVATAGSFASGAVGASTGSAATTGPTAAGAAGDLLFSGLMTGAAPGAVTVNGGLVIREQTPSFSVNDADRKLATAGPQDVTWTLTNSADWYAVAALFHKAP